MKRVTLRQQGFTLILKFQNVNLSNFTSLKKNSMMWTRNYKKGALFVSEKYTEQEVQEIQDRIVTSLETVIDPELGIDIVNLGLIYEVEFDAETGDTLVKMTLTTMGCPLADVITDNIHDALEDLEEVKNVDVKLVWYPAWTTDRMSRYARIALGIR